MIKLNQHLLSAFSEGIQSFRKIFTQVFWQQLLLLLLLFLGCAFIFKVNLGFKFFLGLGAGALFFLGIHLTLMQVFKKQLQHFILKDYRNLTMLLADLFKKSFSVVVGILFIVFLYLALVYVFLGYLGLLGTLTGILLITFLMRIGGAIYWVSCEIAKSLAQGSKNEFPVDQRNPASVLEYVGSFVGAYLGLVQDIVFSILLLLVLAKKLSAQVFHWPIISIEAFYVALVGLVFCALWVAKAFISHRLKQSTHNMLLEFIYAFLVFILGALLIVIAVLYVVKPAYETQVSSSILLMGLSILAIVILLLAIHTFISPSAKAIKSTAASAELISTFPILNAAKIGLQSSAVFYALMMLLFGSFFYFFSTAYQWVLLIGISIPLFGVLVTLVFSNLVMILDKFFQISVSKSWDLFLKKLMPLSRTVAILGNSLNVMISLMMAITLFIYLGDLFTNASFNLFEAILGFGLGALLLSLYLAFLMNGMLKTVHPLLQEISRQFREIPYLKEGKVWPDILSAAQQQSLLVFKQLLFPGLILLLTAFAILFSGMLSFSSGIFLGVFLMNLFQSYQWANLGDVIKNAMFYVEKGHQGGKEGVSFSHLLEARHFSNSFQVILSQAAQIFLKVAILFILISLEI